jgi:hypothetical protein
MLGVGDKNLRERVIIYIKIKSRLFKGGFMFGFSDPAGTRTQGPYIKSVLLYQLSYEIFFIMESARMKFPSF